MIDYLLNGNPVQQISWHGFKKASVSAVVSVTNPNVWLLNQMGLLNLPGVAWDLVPWSFVVNMFTNLGQIANSFTAHYGLKLEDITRTTLIADIRDHKITYNGNDSFGSHNRRKKDRTVGSMPLLTFETKMPELNAELALIALSLAVQQVSRITRLLHQSTR